MCSRIDVPRTFDSSLNDVGLENSTYTLHFRRAAVNATCFVGVVEFLKLDAE